MSNLNELTKYTECTLLAPSQIANCFGPLDRMGMLGKRPPFSPEEKTGGPGNWIRIERLQSQAGRIDLHIDLRDCDEHGFWTDPRPFTTLLDDIKQHPEIDLVRILIKKTIRYIEFLCKEKITDGFKVHIVIHTPNGKTGLGLGGSASSAAVVLAIDALHGFYISNQPEGEQRLLRLMGKAENIVAGKTFYDNVAPLVIKAPVVYLQPQTESGEKPVFSRIHTPSRLHLVTITPNYPLSTRKMNKAIDNQTIDVRKAEAAAASYMNIIQALLTEDISLLIRSAGNEIAEPFRRKYVRGYEKVRRLVDDWNLVHSPSKPKFACGISGSGPTMYVLTDSHANAEYAGYEIHRALKEDNIATWWFCHRPNPNGAEIIELY